MIITPEMRFLALSIAYDSCKNGNKNFYYYDVVDLAKHILGLIRDGFPEAGKEPDQKKAAGSEPTYFTWTPTPEELARIRVLYGRGLDIPPSWVETL